MKKAFVLAAAGIAATASAQSIEFELSDPVLRAPADSTLVTVYADPGPADYALLLAIFNVHASETGWSENMTLIPATAAPPVALDPGTIMGASVTGIDVRQLTIGLTPDPGRIPAWSAVFTIADIAPRMIELSTETTRFEVYEVDPFTVLIPEIRSLTPTEGAARITVVPAPAGLALLGLGGLAAAHRQRPAAPFFCRRRL